MHPVRIVVRGGASAASSVVRAAAHLGIDLPDLTISRVVLLDRALPADAIDRLCRAALVDPVLEHADVERHDGADEPGVVEVGRLPGVTDAEAREIEAVVARLGLGPVRAATGLRYELGAALDADQLDRLVTGVLANPTVDRWAFGRLPAAFGDHPPNSSLVETVPLTGLSAAELAVLSKARLLSLDATELAAIQAFFASVARDPTDAELETLAQTWSEHCAHKTFRAAIDFEHRRADGTVTTERIDGLLKSHLRAATDAAAKPWVVSAFVDNAGIVEFVPGWELAIKVETHNHPSALEPFGGANTGVGGVVRDVIGVSARPIACLDVLCFAPPDTDAAAVPPGVLHPRRVAEGVVAGIGDYGNKLGLPTVAGAVVYDPGYLGNPLVYCGAVGLLPAGSHVTDPRPGALVVVVGGRTGRDGIHGATFSSADMDASTAAIASTAVQIGDPITEKQVLELVCEARDQGLYSALTDCGAGGLSSAVGELGSKTGIRVDLAGVPRKYAGLLPWEVWLSESQERMVLAVPATSWPALAALAERWQVEATVIGAFTDDDRLTVTYGDVSVVDLPMGFVHDGCPRRTMTAIWTDPRPVPAPVPDRDRGADLLALLAHPTVASKESIIRGYDHEVRGGTLVRPWCGPAGDGPTDAAVCVPLELWDQGAAFALAVGVNPAYGRLDPYRMAFAAVDEVFRNLVCVGADPDRVSLLDNFCWGNPTLADRLGGLVRASQGCHAAAVAYGAPFVSGKDSLFNEFEGQPIPGTLLVTGLATVPDLDAVCTSAPPGAGLAVYLVGDTDAAELGGSLWGSVAGFDGGSVPAPLGFAPLRRYRAVHGALRAGLVCAAHDCSEGGLAVALAEMAIAGRVGIDASGCAVDPFAESLGRVLLVTDKPAALEAALGTEPLARVGTTTADGRFRLGSIDLPLDALVEAFS